MKSGCIAVRALEAISLGRDVRHSLHAPIRGKLAPIVIFVGLHGAEFGISPNRKARGSAPARDHGTGQRDGEPARCHASGSIMEAQDRPGHPDQFVDFPTRRLQVQLAMGDLVPKPRQLTQRVGLVRRDMAVRGQSLQ